MEFTVFVLLEKAGYIKSYIKKGSLSRCFSVYIYIYIYRLKRVQGMASQPTVKWAQRKDRLFLTVDIQDIAEEKVALTAEKVLITGKVSRQQPPEA